MSFLNCFSNLIRFKSTKDHIFCSEEDTDSPWYVAAIEIYKIRSLNTPKQILVKGNVLQRKPISGSYMKELSSPPLTPLQIRQRLPWRIWLWKWVVSFCWKPWGWQQQPGGSLCCVTWPGETSWGNMKLCLFGSFTFLLRVSKIITPP